MNAAQRFISRWTSITPSHQPLRPSQSHIALGGSRRKLQRFFHQTHQNSNVNPSPSQPSAIDHERERASEGEHQPTISIKPTSPFIHQVIEHRPTQAVGSDQPWFVDDDPVGSSPVSADDGDLGIDLTSAGPPPSIPTNLPIDLEELYSHLISSPFFDPPSISFIDAKQSPLGDAAWTDWVVIVTLKRGRESAIRGAAEGIQSILEGKMKVRLEGTSSTGSSSTWAMVDGGKVVIHIFNEQSRKLYDLESVWTHPTSSSSYHANQNLEDTYY